MRPDYFSPDIQEFFILLDTYGVKYLIVGGEAVIYYGHAALTGDVDIFYDSSKKNAQNLYQALREFWGGNIPGVEDMGELSKPGMIFMFGVPPNRIDLLNNITNVTFQKAWPSRTTEKMVIGNSTVHIHFIGLNDLIRNKESLGRPRDLEDLKYLKRMKEKSNSTSTTP